MVWRPPLPDPGVITEDGPQAPFYDWDEATTSWVLVPVACTAGGDSGFLGLLACAGARVPLAKQFLPAPSGRCMTKGLLPWKR